MTTIEENKEIVRRVFEEGVNRGDVDFLVEMLTPDYERHSQATTNMEEIRGREQMRVFFEAAFAAFPNWHEKIEFMVAEGDKVALITTATGTHTGPWGELPATGKNVNVTDFIVQRIEDGKIAETWIGWDNLAFLGQLGLITAPEPGGQ